MRPASCCSFATPTLILLVSFVRKLTVLVVEACFSARPMICVWREWMAARITVITSQFVGSLEVVTAIRSSANCGSSIDWLITCAQLSLMMWLGWLEGCEWGELHCLFRYSSREGKMLELCGLGGGRGGCRATMATIAETVVDEGREGQLFLPTLEGVLEMGPGVGLLAWLRSRGFVRVQEAVGTCIGGGVGLSLHFRV